MLLASVFSLLLLSCHALAPGVNRRLALETAATGLVGGSALLNAKPALATADSGLIVPPKKSVLVLGARGLTGFECVSAALVANRPCIATTRSGNFEVTNKVDMLSTATVDVSSQASIEAAIASSNNLGAVIFAASTGSSGRDPFPVDRDGVVNAAKCCIAAGIPRLVVVSSGTVTRPDSAVYKLLNTVGKGIMEAKIQGEDTLRELYADPAVMEKKLGYTVIRPGGLTVEKSVGASALELNQGDSKSGRLSRADVAALCVQCLDSPDAWDTTFECYDAATGKPVESVGLSNIMKSTKPTEFKSGFERRGDSWSALFTGLTRDAGHTV